MRETLPIRNVTQVYIRTATTVVFLGRVDVWKGDWIIPDDVICAPGDQFDVLPEKTHGSLYPRCYQGDPTLQRLTSLLANPRFGATHTGRFRERVEANKA